MMRSYHHRLRRIERAVAIQHLDFAEQVQDGPWLGVPLTFLEQVEFVDRLIETARQRQAEGHPPEPITEADAAKLEQGLDRFYQTYQDMQDVEIETGDYPTPLS
ncbi:MAG: hypothetical protein WDZ51_16410 [Pirellulaceae bacterium]